MLFFSFFFFFASSLQEFVFIIQTENLGGKRGGIAFANENYFLQKQMNCKCHQQEFAYLFFFPSPPSIRWLLDERCQA